MFRFTASFEFCLTIQFCHQCSKMSNKLTNYKSFQSDKDRTGHANPKKGAPCHQANPKHVSRPPKNRPP